MTVNVFKPVKNSSRKTFLAFSCIFFLIISLAAITAYTISARQINRSFVEQQLSIASETIRLRLATTVNSELALVLKMADTPVIRQYFMDPYDPELEHMALVEFDTYLQHFQQKTNFWVNDIDKVFHSSGNESYIVDPDDPESYWYNLTLYRTEKYNFNINYNPDIHQINLWVNVPVFIEENGGQKPLGMLGTGINLTEFSNFVVNAYKDFDNSITPYTFNKFDEITSATDYDLVYNKVHLDDHLGETGMEIIKAARMLSDVGSYSFIYDEKMFLVSSIPAMEWYLTVSYPLPGFLALNQSMNTVFFSMQFLILFMFVVVNIFVARSENAIAKQNIQLLEANMKAETASQAKSDFLAKVSHEIRTPMNAIIGMAELLLRGNLAQEHRMQAQDIKRASSNLISIINDILDFSKIEAGKLEIIPVKYQLSSLINDVVSIIRMRLMEKPIRFFTNIESNIPNGLVGDEVRLRQILLNLLSNAVKYTDKGHISITMTGEERTEEKIWLRIAVADTGHGIGKEDQEKLFKDFIQVDISKSAIEGTGLGLAIAKRLCMAMGGDITMESEYQKGSVFTVLVPQGIHALKPFAAVDNAANKKALIYEGRSINAQSLAWALQDMKVPYTIVSSDMAFSEALKTDEWFFVFSGYGLYEKLKPVMRQTVYSNGKKPLLVLLVEWGTEAIVPDVLDTSLRVCFISLPVQSLALANIFNGKADTNGYFEGSSGFGSVRFTIPHARILVVDDIKTNLKVAEGLIAPYHAMVDTCLSGEQAIELVKKNEYDLVFMDHMMPGMDGIETTVAIRALGKKQLPVIASTANVVSGMRELFLKNGFSDLLAKPIDVSKLDEILSHWIPKEKREWGVVSGEWRKNKDPENNNSTSHSLLPTPNLPSISGVDTAKGIAMTGGTIDSYCQVLFIFCKDTEDRLPLLQTFPDESTLPAFITHVHAIKSASASIGAAEVSALAAELEAAGKTSDLSRISEKLPEFAERLAGLLKEIQTWEVSVKKQIQAENEPTALPLLRELAPALKSQITSNIDRLLEELTKKQLSPETNDALEKISDHVLMAEFDQAGKILAGLLERE